MSTLPARLGLILLIGIASNLPSLAVSDNEISLFDSEGQAVAYIDIEDDQTIYLWGGKPVAYLFKSGDDIHLYGLNGDHLGWFEDGIIRDNKGYAVGFIKGAINKLTRLERLKGLEQLKPLKRLRRLPPLRPMDRERWSPVPLGLFLAQGRD